MVYRFHFIDALKAIGILLFIIWHIFENFYIHPPISSGLFRSVLFVTGFFVFSSGFLIGFHYYPIASLSGKIFWGRLCIRAVKLFLIVLSTGLFLTIIKTRQIDIEFLSPFFNIFSLIYTDRWDVPLQVLIAIGITLIFGMLCIILINNRWFILIISIFLFAVISWEFFTHCRLPYLWRYTFQGVIGIFTGILMSPQKISEISRNLKPNILATMIASLVVFFYMELQAILSPEKYILFLYNTFFQATMVTSFFIGFALFFLFFLDINRFNLIQSTSQQLLLLGKHSLFVYLLQIIVINLILLVYPLELSSNIECISASIILFIFCLASTFLLEYLIKYAPFKILYSAVFR